LALVEGTHGHGEEKCKVPSLGSDTTRVAFFSSLTPSSRLASMGETLFSTIAVTSSRADAADSNLAKFFSFNLSTGQYHNWRRGKQMEPEFPKEEGEEREGPYKLHAPSTDASCVAKSSFFKSFLSLALNRAYPAGVSARTSMDIVFFSCTYGNRPFNCRAN